jgi:NAD(P)-dependent dehydrogenase (short-subunit alcohol dehydrogenase family)
MNELSKLFDLNGKTAIVTGGAGLLGKEFCRTLALAGANVMVADISAPPQYPASAAQQAASEIANQAVGADRDPPLAADRDPPLARLEPVYCDVTDPQSVQHMVEHTLKRFGRLDILVNSAALDPKFDQSSLRQQGGHTNAFEDYPLQAWNQALEVNLTGAFLCCQAAARVMLEQESGVIINLSSIYGLAAPDQRLYHREGQPPQYKPVYYSVTKAGIIGLTSYLAAYFAGKNIRVNTLTPGGVYNNHDEDFVQAYSAKAILGRMADKADMNGALLFLASDASAYMTGANLVVDGGWTTW